MGSLAEVLSTAASEHPDRPALLFRDRTETYAELEERARRAGAALRDLGVAAGDRVALVLGNVPEFVEALYGAWRIGAVVVPVNVLFTPDEVSAVLSDGGARAVVAGGEHLGTVQAAREQVPSLEHVLVTGAEPPAGTVGFEEALGWAEEEARAEEVAGTEIGEDDLALLAYTSGTTGRPKGAMLTHGNLLANLEQIAGTPALQEAESDVVLLVLPLFHIYALNVGLGLTLRVGATALLVERFDPTETLELIRRHGVTIVAGAPPMFSAWLAAAEGRDVDLSSVRLAVSGAAPLPGEVLDAFRRRFGITLLEGYGLTETAPAVTTNAIGPEAKGDSIGLPLTGVDVRLVDEHGEDVEDGDPGEIVVRGPNVFRGYWNRPRDSEGAFLEGGWFRTGDVAYRDDDGYLFIVDRKKDLIIVSGFNVYPAEVEEVLVQHPKVAECAAVGVSDERTGEAVKALVALREGEQATEEEIMEWCSERLARFKLPRTIHFVDALPKHVTGKVLRRALREER